MLMVRSRRLLAGTVLCASRTTSVPLKTVCNTKKFSTRSATLDLKFDVFEPSGTKLSISEGESFGNETRHSPLVILHGLFGSKRNWHSLSKAFARQLGRPVYALDLRNHGDSPHGEPMDYETMAQDVIDFCQKQSLDNIALLGHSMGGKVAMTVALSPDRPKTLLSNLVVADIAPIRGQISSEFQHYADGMQLIEKAGLLTKREAFDKLAEFEEDVPVRQFLLTNLASTPKGEPLRFKVPLSIISEAIPNIGWFPYAPGEASWDGPTLFVKGSMSNYIKHRYLDDMKLFFPNLELEILQASHWLHAEKPKDFLDVVTKFLVKS